MKKQLLAVTALAALAACENPLPPVACEETVQVETVVGMAATAEVCFTDPDEDPLTYQVARSNTNVATAQILEAKLVVTGVSAGTVTVTVTATDPGGLTGVATYAVTVKEPIEGSLDDCGGESDGEWVDMWIKGSVRANVGLSNVRVSGGMGTKDIGSMSENEREDFLITRRIRLGRETGDVTCSIGWTYEIAGGGGR